MLIIQSLFYYATNFGILYLLDRYIEGFSLQPTPVNPMVVALIFTVLNTYIRRLLKYIFTTFVVLSLGLFSLLINAGILMLLDFLSENITINTTQALMSSTIAITLANICIGSISWLLFRKYYYY